MISEIKSVIQWRDEDGHLEEKEAMPRVPDNQYLDYALVSRQVCDENHKPINKVLQINSPQLRKIVGKVSKHHPGYVAVPDDSEQPIEIKEPYMLLCHHLDDLEKYENDPDPTTKKHMELLLGFLNEASGNEYKELIKSNSITFRLVWAIFKPNHLIFHPGKTMSDSRLYLLKDIVYVAGGYGMPTPYWNLSCIYSNYDGKTTGQSNASFTIKSEEFSSNGLLHITSLSIYPLDHHGHPHEVRDDMRKRGEQFLLYCDQSGVQVRHHNGLVHVQGLDTLPGYKGYPRTQTGRVVIDQKTFFEDHGVAEKVVPWDESSTRGWIHQSNDTNMLLPPFVYGYSLEHKCWCKMMLANLRPVIWDKAAFDSLNYDITRKSLIQVLIEFHVWPANPREGSALKGKGLLMLLHGPPGTGKTLTAEAVAESLKKPLLCISTGELGNNQSSIEANLKTFVSYATIWKAVILIDEADVFLEARQSGHSSSVWTNGLVALFLKQLEYFQGIILLTTNRDRDAFDPAVTSRTHLILEYRFPDRKTRRVLWKHELEKMRALDSNFEMEEALDRVDRFKMNAREISNTMNLAKAVSKSKDSGFKVDDLDTVLKAIDPLEERGMSYTLTNPLYRRVALGLLYFVLGLATFVSYQRYSR